MEDLILTKDELKKLFRDEKIVDSGNGWFYDGKEIDIIALHTIEPKYLPDVTNAEYYKIREKN